MVGLRPVAMVIFLLVLSGCSAKGEAGTDELAAAAQQVNLKATDTTGVIRGVVVDEGVRPLASVQLSVTVQGKMMRTNSTTAGAFGFQGLPEGTYFIKAHKAGYNDVQASADVKAGVSDPQVTKIGMATDRSYVRPYNVPLSQKGFIECSTAISGVGAAAVCAVPNACLPIVICVYKAPNLTQDSFSNFFDVDGPPEWVQVELIWKSTQALGDNLRCVTRVSDRQNWKNGYYLRGMNSSAGPSPLLVIDDRSQIYDVKNNGKVVLGNGTGLELDMFATTTSTPSVGVQLNQEYKVIAHLFYGYRPPPGWRFTSNGDPPVPA